MTEETLWEPPTVEIGDEEYQLRRLRIKDLTSLWGVLQNALDEGLNPGTISAMQDDATDKEEMGIQILMKTLPHATEELSRWLAGIVEGLDEEEIDDPEVFPVDAPLEILAVLGEEHRDFKRFFSKAGKASKVLTKIGKNLSLSSSTQSKSDMGGQTNE